MPKVMRVTTLTPATFARASGTALEAVRPAAKASNSAHFRQERGPASGPAPKTGPCLQVELVCQQGTVCHDPFWDGPRLVPAFVTQLLGQALKDECEAAPRQAYAAAASRARFLDATC